MDEDLNYYTPRKAPVAAAITVSVLTSVALFFGLRALDHRGFFGKSGAARPPADVPSLVGLRPEQAREELRPLELLLVLTEERESAEHPAGTIAAQTPLSGSQVPRGSAVQAVLSGGAKKTIVSPPSGAEAHGAPQAAPAAPAAPAGPAAPAAAEPTAAGHGAAPPAAARGTAPLPAGHGAAPAPATTAAAPTEKPAPAARGTTAAPPVAAARENKPAGTTAAESATGGSAGSATAAAEKPLPKVLGMRARAARELLERQGFKVGKVRVSSNDDRSPGVVLEQKPTAGTAAASGAAVDLVVNAD